MNSVVTVVTDFLPYITSSCGRGFPRELVAMYMAHLLDVFSMEKPDFRSNLYDWPEFQPPGMDRFPALKALEARMSPRAGAPDWANLGLTHGEDTQLMRCRWYLTDAIFWAANGEEEPAIALAENVFKYHAMTLEATDKVFNRSHLTETYIKEMVAEEMDLESEILQELGMDFDAMGARIEMQLAEEAIVDPVSAEEQHREEVERERQLVERLVREQQAEMAARGPVRSIHHHHHHYYY